MDDCLLHACNLAGLIGSTRVDSIFRPRSTRVRMLSTRGNHPATKKKYRWYAYVVRHTTNPAIWSCLTCSLLEHVLQVHLWETISFDVFCTHSRFQSKYPLIVFHQKTWHRQWEAPRRKAKKDTPPKRVKCGHLGPTSRHEQTRGGSN